MNIIMSKTTTSGTRSKKIPEPRQQSLKKALVTFRCTGLGDRDPGIHTMAHYQTLYKWVDIYTHNYTYTYIHPLYGPK